MRYFYALLITVFIGNLGFGQTTILSEDFETDGDGTRYSVTGGFTDGVGDYFVRTNGTTVNKPAGLPSYNSQSSSFYFAAEDTQDVGNPNSDTSDVTFNDINISGFTNITIEGLFACGGKPKFDPNDYMHVYIDVDNTGTWTLIGAFEADISEGSNSSNFGLDADLNGQADGPAYLSTTFGSYSFNLGTTGNLLDVKIEVLMHFGDEEVAFDLIEVKGTSTSTAPTGVSTGTSGSITAASAIITGNDVTGDGGSAITERGVAYSTTSPATIADNTVTDPGTTGNFDATISGLASSTQYFVRAYATNAVGTTYGNEIDFTTNAPAGDSDSDIIENTGFTYPTNIDYAAAVNSGPLNSGNSIEVAQFTIRDGGAGTDADALSTTLTNLDLSISEHTNLDRVALFNGTSLIQEVAAASSVSFTGLSLTTADNSTQDFSVRVSFQSTVTDNAQLGFTLTAATAQAGGSLFASGDAGGAASSIDGDNNRIEVTASALIFDQDVSNVQVSQVMSPSPSLQAIDENANLDLDFTGSVSLAITTGTTTFDATATTSANAIGGIATFNNLIFDSVAAGNVLTASATGLADDSSASFDVIAAPVVPSLIITEVADPGDNANDGRFVELYNNGTTSIDLTNEQIFFVRQANGGGFSSIALSGIILPNQVFVLGGSSNFSTTYGFSDDLFFGSITGNGDDGYFLYYGGDENTGTMLDAYGVLGEDGTGKDWEYENSRALRNNPKTTNPNATWTASEWTIASADVVDMTPGALENDYRFDGDWKPRDANGNASASDDILVLSGNTNVTSDIIVNTVSISSGATLTVNPGQSLTTAGDLSNSGTLVLNSTSTEYSSLIVNGTVTGDVTYNRYTAQIAPTGTNDLIASPFSGQTFGAFATANDGVLAASTPLRAFAPFNNNSNAYDNYDTSSNDQTVITSGKGYRAGTINGETLAFEGTLSNSNLSVPLTVGSGSFWNLIGNPYSSYMDTAAFLAANNANLRPSYVAIYGYNGDNSNGQNSRWTILDSNTAPNSLITPGQGFFVAAPDGGGTSAEFTLAMRTTGSIDDFIAGRNTTSDANFAHAILNLNTASASYGTNVYFRDINTLGLDPGYDTGAFDQTANGIYSHLVADNTGVALANQSLPFTSLSDQSVPLVVNANAGEQLTFSLNTDSNIPSNINVYLEDQLSGSVTLLNSSAYVLTPASNLSGPGRFYLRFTDNALNVNQQDLSTINLYAVDKELVIAGFLQHRTTATIFDIQGRAILSVPLDVSSQLQKIDMGPFTTGIYIVQLTNNITALSQKIILK